MLGGILAGIALLALLALVVAGLQRLPRRRTASRLAGSRTDDFDPLAHQRRAQIAIAAVLSIGAALLVYGANEPSRQAAAVERQRAEAVERGQHGYTLYCYGCHGFDGRGAIVPGHNVPAPSVARFRATGDSTADRQTRDALQKAIARGRPGTTMDPWGQSDDGPLNDAEIAEIVTFLMYGDFGGIAWQVRTVTPVTPVVPGGPPPPAARARGLFALKGCAACHTIQEIATARGTIGPDLSPLGTKADQEERPADLSAYVRESILQPSAFLSPGYQNLMPPYTEVPNGTNAGPTQFTTDDLNLLVEYLSKLGTSRQGHGSGHEPPATPHQFR